MREVSIGELFGRQPSSELFKLVFNGDAFTGRHVASFADSDSEMRLALFSSCEPRRLVLVSNQKRKPNVFMIRNVLPPEVRAWLQFFETFTEELEELKSDNRNLL